MCRHEVRLQLQDVSVLVLYLVTPIVLMLFIRPATQAILTQDGHRAATGLELAVPGMAVMFSFYVIGAIGYAFFREHGWHTWNRLRSLDITSAEIMAGKGIFGLTLVLVQQIFLFSLGALLYGYRPNGSWAGVALVGFSLSVFVVSFGLLATSVVRTVQQLNVISNLVPILLGGVGGALIPVTSLPAWMQAIAPTVPTYWAVQGFERVSLEPGGVAAAAVPCLVLGLFSALALGGTLWRFRFEDTKVSWA